MMGRTLHTGRIRMVTNRSLVQYLMSGIIKGSDFDDWHKRVLIKIIKGYYVDAYNDISDLIGKTRYIPGVSEF